MLRTAAGQISKLIRPQLVQARAIATTPKRFGHGEPDIHSDAFDTRYEQFFNKPDIDGWLIRKGMNDLLGMDLVPDPKIVVAALKACRRVNDYALAIRWLEGVRDKCGDKKAEIYPWLLQEIQPTLKELGVLTPEEMGYGEPELALKSVFDRS
ncbi:cytochrome c oxidase subunit 5A, mitochondrial-like [Bradysia coprophila]|uniref:cytochrome c oxidase subunit 5A, mitochondrial-like n=1 Tax=Bradysia coprophila TaxID=38358 RepID=UPI00187DC619|nr:cytochrome c oxidase subunit 5A, mitochondrial-like [Bradysia coprophila]XP_037049086.1 cytochrome c oxidase subunit 5A, mitochondrial-like [Bradysia coprophila]